MTGSCEHRSKPSDYTKGCEFLDQLNILLASQDGLSSTEVVVYLDCNLPHCCAVHPPHSHSRLCLKLKCLLFSGISHIVFVIGIRSVNKRSNKNRVDRGQGELQHFAPDSIPSTVLWAYRALSRHAERTR